MRASSDLRSRGIPMSRRAFTSLLTGAGLRTMAGPIPWTAPPRAEGPAADVPASTRQIAILPGHDWTVEPSDGVVRLTVRTGRLVVTLEQGWGRVVARPLLSLVAIPRMVGRGTTVALGPEEDFSLYDDSVVRLVNPTAAAATVLLTWTGSSRPLVTPITPPDRAAETGVEPLAP